MPAVRGIGDVCREDVYGCEVLFLEPRVLLEDLLLGHSVGQPAQNVVYRDPHSANTGLAVALVCLNGDPGMHRCHAAIITQRAHSWLGLARRFWISTVLDG